MLFDDGSGIGNPTLTNVNQNLAQLRRFAEVAVGNDALDEFPSLIVYQIWRFRRMAMT
jgi:hypothetical protein